MNFRAFAIAIAVSIVSAVSAQAAMVTAATPVTFVFDTSGLGSSFDITSGNFQCTASCPAGNNVDAPEALAIGASLGFDFGTSAGGDDIATREYKNNFGFAITNVSGGIFGSDITVSGPLSLLYVTLFFVDDEYGVDSLSLYNDQDALIGQLVTSEVPLPAALPFFLAGLAGLGLGGRKRKQAA